MSFVAYPAGRWVDRMRWTVGLAAVAACLLASPVAGWAQPAHLQPIETAKERSARLLLKPGHVIGRLQAVKVHRGEDLNDIAFAYGLHPVRVTKPSAEVIKHGVRAGMKVFIDTREILPRLGDALNGIVLNVPEAEVYFVANGDIRSRYPVAVSTTDWRAPIGDFHVVDMTPNPTWHVPKSIQAEMAKHGQEVKTEVEPGPKNPLGVRWIGFADGTYGFHGTNSPYSIKRYASHGCVRFLKKDIIDLYKHARMGMAVHVVYQPVLLAVDKRGVWLSAYPDIYELGYDYPRAVKTLAQWAGVEKRLNAEAVKRVLASRDGLMVDVSHAPPPLRPLVLRSPAPTPAPSGHASARPSARPSTRPSTRPSARPAPSLAPRPTPAALPSAEPAIENGPGPEPSPLVPRPPASNAP